jgi:hypothetical protein
MCRYDLAGKTMRLREFGWWLHDPPHYYSHGRYLTYANDVKAYVARYARAWAQQHGVKDVAWHHKHMVAVAFQIAVLQSALGIAWALNRTLVLPQVGGAVPPEDRLIEGLRALVPPQHRPSEISCGAHAVLVILHQLRRCVLRLSPPPHPTPPHPTPPHPLASCPLHAAGVLL